MLCISTNKWVLHTPFAGVVYFNHQTGALHDVCQSKSRKRRKKLFKLQKIYFDQETACEAPVHGSKYTTEILAIKNAFKAFFRYQRGNNMKRNWCNQMNWKENSNTVIKQLRENEKFRENVLTLLYGAHVEYFQQKNRGK